MGLLVRKIVTYIEDVHAEGGRPVSPPLRSGIVAAVLTNPWAGRGYVEDLSPEINEIAPVLGNSLTDRMLELLGPADNIEAYGKAAIVGVGGEVEHASALIHTLRFGNAFRDKVAGTSYLSFTNKRGPAGSTVTIPLIHKGDSAVRSHYLTVETSVADGPADDEILVAIGAATGGRPFARLGDRRQDLAEMGLT